MTKLSEQLQNNSEDLQTKIQESARIKADAKLEEIKDMLNEYFKYHKELSEMIDTYENDGLSYEWRTMVNAIARLSAFGRAVKETGESYNSMSHARCVL